MVTGEMNEKIKKGGRIGDILKFISTEFYSEITENKCFDMVPVNGPCLGIS